MMPLSPKPPRRINHVALACVGAFAFATLIAAANGIRVPASIHIVALLVVWVQHPTKETNQMSTPTNTITYALVIAANGILAKSLTIPIPRESGVVGFIEQQAETFVVGGALKLVVDLTFTKSPTGVTAAATVDIGPLKEAFGFTEHISGIEELLVAGALGSGKTETFTADVVETS